jgi:hypothetical protein
VVRCFYIAQGDLDHVHQSHCDSQKVNHIAIEENPGLVVPLPSSSEYPLCGVCDTNVATQQSVPDPATWENWPERKGKYPMTHCRECAMAAMAEHADHTFVINPVWCLCGKSRGQQTNTMCYECVKGSNTQLDCIESGCENKRFSDKNKCYECLLNNCRTKECNVPGCSELRYDHTQCRKHSIEYEKNEREKK